MLPRMRPLFRKAIRIKKLAQQSEFSYDAVYDIMNEEKKSELDTVTIKKRNPAEILSAQLHAPADGKHHHQAARPVAAEKQQEKQKKQEEAR